MNATKSYLVTDTRTLEQAWIEAPSAREALIARSNAIHGTRLPVSARASHYSHGPIIDVSLADVAIRGLRSNVERE